MQINSNLSFNFPSSNPTFHQEQQMTPCSFAFIKREGDIINVLHKPVLCRDYFMDSLTSMYNKDIKDQTIYGWISKAYPIREDLFEIYVYSPGLLWHDNIFDYLMTLAKQEVKHEVKEKNHIFTADAFWMQSTIHHSLLTSCIRAGFINYMSANTTLECLQKGRNSSSGDSNLNYLCKYGVKLLKNLHKLDVSEHTKYNSIIEKYQSIISVVHNYSGYVSACQSNYNIYNKQVNALLSL